MGEAGDQGGRNLNGGVICATVFACWLIAWAGAAVWIRDSGFTSTVPVLKERVCREVDFDAFVLGNSRVYHGFDPESFDAEMARHGRAVHSFNFGIPSASNEDCEVMLENFVIPRKPKLVVLQSDANWFRRGYADRQETHQTLEYWANAGQLLRARRRGVLDSEDVVRCMLGRFFPFIRYRVEMRSFLVHALGGDFEVLRRYRDYLEPAGYARQDRDPRGVRVRHVKPPNGETRVEEREALERALEIALKVRDAGLDVVVVEYPSSLLTPTEAYRREVAAHFESKGIPYLYYAPLWFQDGKFFYDTTHLNHAGASELSRRMASDLCALYPEGGGAAP